MNKLLVIENEPSDFEKVKKIFIEWQLLPKIHTDIDYKNYSSIIEYIKNAIYKEKISSIIMDISLIDNIDETGFDLI